MFESLAALFWLLHLRYFGFGGHDFLLHSSLALRKFPFLSLYYKIIIRNKNIAREIQQYCCLYINLACLIHFANKKIKWHYYKYIPPMGIIVIAFDYKVFHIWHDPLTHGYVEWYCSKYLVFISLIFNAIIPWYNGNHKTYNLEQPDQSGPFVNDNNRSYLSHDFHT